MIGTIQSKLKLKSLALLLGIITVAVFSAVLVQAGSTTPDAVISELLRFTLVLLALTAFLWWLDRYGWRQVPFLGKYTRVWPDLRGRWVGTIDRDGPDPPHKIVLEVFQTLTSLRCTTYSENGRSDSSVAVISNSEDGLQAFLIYVWLGNTTGMVKRSKSGLFYGTTVLELADRGSSLRWLTGIYWTNRTPYQTKGALMLKFAGTRIRGRFE